MVKNLDKIIIAEKPNEYLVAFENTCAEFNKKSDIEKMKSYIQGIYIGCYCSRNFLDSKDFVQNGYTSKDKWRFGGNPLPEKDFKKLCNSLWPKTESSFD